MFKLFLIATLAVAGACAQLAPTQEAAPEPYAYEYSTDTHGASEQRGPDGRVTGFYTLQDADGRVRRVEYVADEAGFRAKVQTNEVGTKSENSADVEVLASPPTQEQLAQTNVVSTQRATYVQQPAAQLQKSVSYVQQPLVYSNGYYNQPGAYYSSNLNGLYGYGYGYGAPAGGYYRSLQGPASYNYGSYYSQLPAAYRSYQTVTSAPAQAYSYRAGYQTVGVPATSSVSYQTLGAPAGGIRYQTVGVPAQAGVFRSQTYRSVSAPSSLQSSGNYLLLKKRDAEDNKKSSA